MRMSAGVEWAVHCCVVLSRSGGPVPAARLADFHGVSRTYLAKHMQSLAAAGIVEAVEGRHGGYELARPAEDLTLRDVVEAIEGRRPVFGCSEIRQRGPMPASGDACNRPCAVAQAMHEAERAYLSALAGTSIADLADQVERDQGGGVFGPVADWLRPGDGTAPTAGG